jgi:hypothetical protein
MKYINLPPPRYTYRDYLNLCSGYKTRAYEDELKEKVRIIGF